MYLHKVVRVFFWVGDWGRKTNWPFGFYLPHWFVWGKFYKISLLITIAILHDFGGMNYLSCVLNKCSFCYIYWFRVINNYWMRLSMISWIIKTERHKVLIIHDVMRKPNSIIVLLYILILRNSGEAFSHPVSEENISRGLVTRQTLSFT